MDTVRDFIVFFTTVDGLRTFNWLAAAFALIGVVLHIGPVWHDLPFRIKLMVYSIVAFLVSCCYGTMEILYWPQYEFRVSVIAAAIVFNLISLWLIRKNNKTGKKVEW